MRKIWVLFALVLVLFSCGEKFDILSYQEGDISAKCLVNDKYIINVEKTHDIRTLSIIEPIELETISFKIENNECVASCDGADIPLDIEKLDGIVALCSIFDLNEGAISSSSVDESGTTVSFSMQGVSYAVSYGQNNLPTHIEISGEDFSLNVKILELTK